MILCDHEIEAAIAAGDIVIEPPPTEEQYTSSALDLTLGDEFVAIRAAREIEAAEPCGVQRPIIVDAAEIDLPAFLTSYAARLPLEADGSFVLNPISSCLASHESTSRSRRSSRHVSRGAAPWRDSGSWSI